jgi:flagellar biosynthesis protein FlhF
MRVERFKAPSLRKVMTAIKAKLGEDAVILHSRYGDHEVEVIAAVDEVPKYQDSILSIKTPKKLSGAVPQPVAAPSFSSTEHDLARKDRAAAVTYDRPGKQVTKHPEETMQKGDSANGSDHITGWEELLELAVRNGNGHTKESRGMIDTIEPVAEQAGNRAVEDGSFQDEWADLGLTRKLWMKSEKRMEVMRQEIAELKEILLRQELVELRNRAHRLQHGGKSRDESERVSQSRKNKKFFAGIAQKLQKHGIPMETAMSIVNRLQQRTSGEQLTLTAEGDIRQLREMLEEEIARLIKVTSVMEDVPGQRRIVLVGPQNSGKTSTAIKMALRNSLLHDKKVAMILVSTSAHTTTKHLSPLANAARLPLAIVTTPKELQSIIAAHDDKELLLIDFAMQAKSDDPSVLEFFSAANATETHLVIPADFMIDDVSRTVDSFRGISFDSVVLTKIDNLKTPGSIVQIIEAVGKPLSYVCNGELIPDHIERANKAKLTHLILKG